MRAGSSKEQSLTNADNASQSQTVPAEVNTRIDNDDPLNKNDDQNDDDNDNPLNENHDQDDDDNNEQVPVRRERLPLRGKKRKQGMIVNTSFFTNDSRSVLQWPFRIKVSS